MNRLRDFLLLNAAGVAGQRSDTTKRRLTNSARLQQKKFGVGEKMKKATGVAPNYFLSH
jgi:hypothetical protein